MAITEAEFQARWASDSPDAFVRYAPNVLAVYGMTEPGRAFLAECGLPPWAAPHIRFFFAGGSRLPQPMDPYGTPFPSEFARLGMIGSTGEDWPICLDRQHPGEILCIELERPHRARLVNSSVSQLAATLLAYNEMVEAALAYGEARGHADAWRHHQYPLEFEDHLRARIGDIDPPALAPGAYWEHHFEVGAMPPNRPRA